MVNAFGIEESIEERCHQLLDYWRQKAGQQVATGVQLTEGHLQSIAELAAALKRYDYEEGKVLDR